MRNRRRSSALRRVREEDSSSCDDDEERNNERVVRHRRHIFRRLRALLVVELSPCADDAVIQWIVAKMRAPLVNGGAGLRVRILNRGQSKDPKGGTLLLLAASTQRLLEAAHVKRFPRKTIHNRWRTFNLKNVNLYLQPGMCAHQLLTTIEKQRFLVQFLGDLRSFPPESRAPGSNEIIFCPGESIIRKFLQVGIITHIFPLHERSELEKVGYGVFIMALFTDKSLETVRSYFGDAVALYLAFMGACTKAMILPALIGIAFTVLRSIQCDVDDPCFPFLCILNCIIILTLSFTWRQKCCRLAYDWGTIKIQETREGPRANYRGKLVLNPITGYCEYIESHWISFARNFCISMPVMMLYRSFIGIIAWYAFYNEKDESEGENQGEKELEPGFDWTEFSFFLEFAFILWLLQRGGEILILILTEWENHRTDLQFEKHRNLKRANLLFTVNFSPLFYYLFMGKISNVANLFLAVVIINYAMKIITQGIFNLQSRIFIICTWLPWGGNKCRDGDDITPPQDPVVVSARSQTKLKRYHGQFDDDYFFPMTQLCLIFIFSSFEPIAATVAFIGNILSTVVDCFNLTRLTQRPFNYDAKCCTPSWRLVFDLVMSLILAVNCIIIGHSTFIRKLVPLEMSDANWIFAIIVVEHVIILIKYFLNQVIPDTPDYVCKLMEDEEFEENVEDGTERHRSLQVHLSTNHRRYR